MKKFTLTITLKGDKGEIKAESIKITSQEYKAIEMGLFNYLKEMRKRIES